MTDTLKQTIQEILNNEKDINKLIDKIKEVDKKEEINTIWYNTLTYKELEELIREQTDLCFMVEILKEINEDDLWRTHYFYFDGICAYPVQRVEQDIRNEIEEQLW